MGKTKIKDIGYCNVMIYLHEPIREFYMSSIDVDNQEIRQELKLEIGLNVIQLPIPLVDDFIYALRLEHDGKIKEIKLLDLDANEQQS